MKISVHRKRSHAAAGWTVATAAAGIGCLVLTAASAAGQPIPILDSGAIEVPNGISIPMDALGGELPGRTEIPGFEIAPLTFIPGAEPQSVIDAAGLESLTSPSALGVDDPRVIRAVGLRAIPGVGLPFLSGLPAAVQSLLAGVPGVEFPFLTDVPGSRPPALPRVAAPRTIDELAVDLARSELESQHAGGAGPDAFDCSGLAQWFYDRAGTEVHRTSYERLGSGTLVSADELEPGDPLSCYAGGHAGLYTGEATVIHASTYSSGVEISPMASMPQAGARRF
ncbi:C40 family peptidase [Nocardia sp. NBC_01009]|uniref:C40 family peptidase n=1 Tax=Nocardia sp. NBC_01009 TaxID=2975996 RepID=UPI0038634BDD|nr:C40 family peptidase [Nocardia sp. NBC_01009]